MYINRKYFFILIHSIILSLPIAYLSLMQDKNNSIKNIQPNLEHSTYTTEQNSDSSAQAQDTFPGVSGLEAGKLFVKHKFGYEEGVNYKVSSSYESGPLTHVYLQQLNQGKEVDNGTINISVDKNGKIIAFGDSFDKSFNSSSNATANPEDWGSPVDALFSLFSHLKVDPKVSQNEVNIQQAEGDTIEFSNIPIASGEVKAQQKFIQVKTGQLEKVWNLEVDLGDDIWDASVTPNGEIVRLNNLVSN